MRRPVRTTLLGAVALFAVACAGPAGTSSPSTPAGAAATTPPASPSPTADACAKAALETVTEGKLTVGTDNPAYPPYFGGEPPADGSWEISDPNSGEGFESAVAYAVAEEMGFAKGDVVWVVVPFNNSYAPGPKQFDFDINQVAFTPERAETADLSEGYYFSNQSLVTLADNPFASATSVAELKDARLGAQVGTTSYDYIVEVIQPTPEAKVYDTNDLAIEALKAKQLDGILVDLPTASFITEVQVEGAKLVGQFQTAEGEQEHFSLVLEKDSALTPCVNRAITALRDGGTLDDLVEQWLPFQADTPVIAP